MFVNEIFENSDDMFAMPWRTKVVNLLIKLLESPARQRSAEIEPDDIDDIKLLIDALQKNDINKAKAFWDRFSYTELDNALYLYVERLRPDIDLFKLLGDVDDDYIEESDDMFASAFRPERDVMVWQRDAARIAGVRGMHSKKLGDDIVFWIQEKDGPVTGVYYSPQPARDETNIGTWNKRFRGDLEQYMAQDPHNPFKQVNEDDMFAPSKHEREFQLLDNPRLMRLYKQTAQFAKGRPANQKSLGRIAMELNRRGLPEPDTMLKHLYGRVKSAVREDDDDMFSAEPRYFQKLGNSIENYGEGYLEMGRDVQYSQDEAVHEYAGDLMRNGKAMLRAGASFKKGMQQGLADWVLVDRDVREDYYTYTREVENWDAEKIINDFVGLKEDAAGVGVVKNSKDPRYVMATMGDQNDVTAETLPKMMKAYSLVGKKAKK